MSEIIHGDTLTVLRDRFADESVQCVVTSPPYYGLRDYKIPPTIFGGDSSCAHRFKKTVISTDVGKGNWAQGMNGRGEVQPGGVQVKRQGVKGRQSLGWCRCGAWSGCLGLEPTPQLFIDHLVEVFREVRRVLKKDGTLWMNLGDSYANDTKWGGATGGKHVAALHGEPVGRRKRLTGLKPKDMVGMPWRVALALQADGWYLRADIIWHKNNPMPESVTDRPTKAHEYLFLLSKSARYYYDADAIKEPASGTAHIRGTGVHGKCFGWAEGPGSHRAIDHAQLKGKTPGKFSRIHVDRDPAHLLTAKQPRQNASFSAAVKGLVDSRNKRSVWTIPTQPYRDAHFATFPEALVEPCVLAGSRPGDIVLDVYAGSGTVPSVAKRLGRRGVGIELNAEYVAMAERRCQQEALPL